MARAWKRKTLCSRKLWELAHWDSECVSGFEHRVSSFLPGARSRDPRRWPGVSLCGRGGDARAKHLGNIDPAVNVLAGANPNGLAGFRHAIPGHVKLGDVAPAVYWGRQQPQEREVLHTADACPDRPAPCTRMYCAGGPGTRSLIVILPPMLVMTNSTTGLWLEDGLGGREVELGQAKIGAPGVQAHKEVVAIAAHPAARLRL